MKIVNPIFFFSTDSIQSITVDSTSTISAPRMMPQTAFTQMMISLNDNMTETTKVSMILSFIINLFLSGPIDFLWGLINTLQIVMHFPLIHVMMPANAY